MNKVNVPVEYLQPFLNQQPHSEKFKNGMIAMNNWLNNMFVALEELNDIEDKILTFSIRSMTRTFINGINATNIESIVHDINDPMPPRREFVLRLMMLMTASVYIIGKKGKIYRDKDLRFAIYPSGTFNPRKFENIELTNPKYLFTKIYDHQEEDFDSILNSRYGDDLKRINILAKNIKDKKVSKKLLANISKVLETKKDKPLTKLEKEFDKCLNDARTISKYINTIKRSIISIMNEWLCLGIDMRKAVDADHTLKKYICNPFAYSVDYLVKWYLYILYVDYYK